MTNSTPSVFPELFASGQQGAWYDPSDFAALYQDAAGTVPVTAVGQPVGKAVDKSGRGNHATQSTATARPVVAEVTSGHSQSTRSTTGSLSRSRQADGLERWCLQQTRDAGLRNQPYLPGSDIGGIIGLYFPGSKLYGVVLRNGSMTDSQIVRARAGASQMVRGCIRWRFKLFLLLARPLISGIVPGNEHVVWNKFSYAWYWLLISGIVPSNRHVVWNKFCVAWYGCFHSGIVPQRTRRLEQIFKRVDELLISGIVPSNRHTSSGTSFSYAWYGCSSRQRSRQ